MQVNVQDDGAAKELDEDVLTITYQALQELLINVLKHAQTPMAALALSRTGDYLEVAVMDEGVGFDVVSTQALSTGEFGLLNIQQRVESLGGRLEIVSALNRGTSKIFVPLKAKAETSLSPHEPRTTASLIPNGIPRAGQMLDPKIRVLLVDDHRVMREGLRHLIEGEADLDVVGEAADGELAVQATRTLRPDVVVKDINMPKVNGVEATRQITTEFRRQRTIIRANGAV